MMILCLLKFFALSDGKLTLLSWWSDLLAYSKHEFGHLLRAVSFSSVLVLCGDNVVIVEERSARKKHTTFSELLPHFWSLNFFGLNADAKLWYQCNLDMVKKKKMKGITLKIFEGNCAFACPDAHSTASALCSPCRSLWHIPPSTSSSVSLLYNLLWPP